MFGQRAKQANFLLTKKWTYPLLAALRLLGPPRNAAGFDRLQIIAIRSRLEAFIQRRAIAHAASA